MEERHHYRGGLVWPVIVIGAGVIFLLNNLGVLGWEIWESLWRLWPVLLIAIGLEMLFGRRSLLGSLLVVALLVGVLAWAVGWGAPQWNVNVANRVDRTETINEALQGAERAAVEIDFGMGSLQLTALPAGSNNLVEGTVDLARDERLELNHNSTSQPARLILRSQGTTRITDPGDMRADSKVWDLALNRDVPLDLKIATGVGASTLDLARLNLSGLELEGGVGQTTVTLPQRGRFQAQVSSGIGELTIILPQSLAARIRVDKGLSGLSVNGDFDRRDNEYTSRNYAAAEDRVELIVDGGLGRIVIRQAVE